MHMLSTIIEAVDWITATRCTQLEPDGRKFGAIYICTKRSIRRMRSWIDIESLKIEGRLDDFIELIITQVVIAY